MKREVWKEKESDLLGMFINRKSTQKDSYLLKLDTFYFFPWGEKSKYNSNRSHL